MHLETRKGSSGKYQLYLEIESKSNDDWNSIRSIVETLNGIDIKPREDGGNFNMLADEEDLEGQRLAFAFTVFIKCQTRTLFARLQITGTS